MLFYRAEIFIY